MVTLHREYLYNDLIKLFENPDVVEYFPFKVSFKGEMGVDTGGLSREAFFTFWEDVYTKHCDGACLVTPIVCAGLNSHHLKILGRIISYGYISCGFLPVRIGFPTLAAILVQSFSDVSADILLRTFKNSLTPVDLSTVNEALSCKTTYPPYLSSKLIDLFSRYDCLEVPKPGNILRLCQHICQYLFIDKPFLAIIRNFER